MRLRPRRRGRAAEGRRPGADRDGRPKRGTEVTFLPSPRDLHHDRVRLATLEHRLRELAFLNSGVRIVLTDARGAEPKREELHYEGGLEAFVRYLDRAKTPLIDKPILDPRRARRHRASRSRCGGTTATTRTCCASPTTSRSATAARISIGFRSALTRAGHRLRRELRPAKKEKVDLTGDDCREGLTCVLSVKVPDPKFSSQTKDKLVSSEVRPVVEGLVNELLGAWFEEHPDEARDRRRQGGRGRAGARGGAQGARTDAAQGRARHREPARQARRLPGARSGQVRDLHRRGRFGRRLRQAGPQPRVPGGAAAARQDPQRRARALRQDAVAASRSAR